MSGNLPSWRSAERLLQVSRGLTVIPQQAVAKASEDMRYPEIHSIVWSSMARRFSRSLVYGPRCDTMGSPITRTWLQLSWVKTWCKRGDTAVREHQHHQIILSGAALFNTPQANCHMSDHDHHGESRQPVGVDAELSTGMRCSPTSVCPLWLQKQGQ